MQITMWVLGIVGLIEVLANSLFLYNMVTGKGLRAAKKFHGDFPAYASDKAWRYKLLVSIILGIIALASALPIYLSFGRKIILSWLFAGGMLIICVIQAILYGNKHKPAIFSIIVGLILVGLVLFRV